MCEVCARFVSCVVGVSGLHVFVHVCVCNVCEVYDACVRSM